MGTWSWEGGCTQWVQAEWAYLGLALKSHWSTVDGPFLSSLDHNSVHTVPLPFFLPPPPTFPSTRSLLSWLSFPVHTCTHTHPQHAYNQYKSNCLEQRSDVGNTSVVGEGVDGEEVDGGTSQPLSPLPPYTGENPQLELSQVNFTGFTLFIFQECLLLLVMEARLLGDL